MMEQDDIDKTLVQLGLPNHAVLANQIFNNGSFNHALIHELTAKGIIVKIVFGQEHPDHYVIEIDPSKLVCDVSDVPFQVVWPSDIARILNFYHLATTQALSRASKIELKLLEGMTPRMLEYIMRELHNRQIFLPDYPTPERRDIVLGFSIESLKLPKRIQQILLDEKIFTLGNLISWTYTGLCELAGLGTSSVREIQRKLDAIGLAFSRNPFSTPTAYGRRDNRLF